MGATTLTAMPASHYAGDTLLLGLSYADYLPSDGWVLTFTFKSKSGTISFASTGSTGSTHDITVAAATTAEWPPEEYLGFGAVAKGGQQFTVWKGNLKVEPNLVIQGSDYDPRSHAQKCLDSINAVLEGKATRDVLSSTIAGQSISRLSPRELLEFRAYYAAQVEAEKGALLAAQGKSTGNHILIRFGAP